jgi:amino acid permease
VVSVLVVIMPLAFLRNLSGLRIVAIMSIVTLLYVAVITIVEFPFYYQDTKLEGLVYFRLNEDFFTAFALCMFAYLSHPNLPTIYSELTDRSQRRIRKVVRRSIIL